MKRKPAKKLPFRLSLTRFLFCVAAFLLGLCMIPRWWCGREADAWYRGDADLQKKLALGVSAWITNDLSRSNFSTGSARFNGEWLFGTYMMAGMGFAQTAQEHPEWRELHVQLMEQCIERILSPDVRAFDTESWRDDAIESLDGDSDHAAFLGYFNLLLSYNRLLDPNSKYAELNDRITVTLVRRLEESRHLLLQSYPGELYPVDNSAVIGSIGLYDRATGANHSDLIRKWVVQCRTKFLNAETGLLYQAIATNSGNPVDAPRGSGTCLGLYFLSFADSSLAAELQQAVGKNLARSIIGFGLVREYPVNIPSGRGDIDSGPVVFGYGVSATGFYLAGCRRYGDAGYFKAIYRLVHLFGAPLDSNGVRHFVSGGPLGDAILLAMLTAQPVVKVVQGEPQ